MIFIMKPNMKAKLSKGREPGNLTELLIRKRKQASRFNDLIIIMI